jgi:hypothetical protein
MPLYPSAFKPESEQDCQLMMELKLTKQQGELE